MIDEGGLLAGPTAAAGRVKQLPGQCSRLATYRARAAGQTYTGGEGAHPRAILHYDILYYTLYIITIYYILYYLLCYITIP